MPPGLAHNIEYYGLYACITRIRRIYEFGITSIVVSEANARYKTHSARLSRFSKDQLNLRAHKYGAVFSQRCSATCSRYCSTYWRKLNCDFSRMRGLLGNGMTQEKNLVAVAALALTEVPLEGGEFQNIWSLFLPKGVCSFYHMELDPASIVGASLYHFFNNFCLSHTHARTRAHTRMYYRPSHLIWVLLARLTSPSVDQRLTSPSVA